jgi:cytochrome c-type biogenesis protein CcmH
MTNYFKIPVVVTTAVKVWPAGTALMTALVAALCLSFAAQAVELRSFSSPEDEERFRELVAELRCLVCQNQSLADSDAELAQDLRREVHEMIDAGKSNDDITDFMVARYGDFVLYRPPFNGTTAALWIAPFAVGGLGLLTLFLTLRARRAKPDEPTDNAGSVGDAQELLRRHRGEDA